MKLVVNKKEFIDTLQEGSIFVSKNNIPALANIDCIKVDIIEKNIYITSTDMENIITQKMSYLNENDKEISFCLNISELIDYLRLIIDNEITLDINESKNNITIIHKTGKKTCTILDSSVFPLIKDTFTTPTLSIEADIIRTWINLAKNFINPSDLRPAITGLYFYTENNVLGIAGTDGYRLIHDYIYNEAYTVNNNFILNNHAFTPVINMANKCSSLDVFIGDKHIILKNDNTTLICRSIETNYPNFKSVIPTYHNIEFMVNKNEFINSIKRLSMSINKKDDTIKMDIKNGNIDLIGENITNNTVGIEFLSCNSEKEISVCIKSGFLLTVLNAITSDMVKIQIIDTSHAIVAKEDTENTNKTVLCMLSLEKQ